MWGLLRHLHIVLSYNCIILLLTLASQAVLQLGIFSRTRQDSFINGDEVCRNCCCSTNKLKCQIFMAQTIKAL